MAKLSRAEFIEMIAPMCVKTMVSKKILASLSIAQGILESGDGSSELATKGNALFGIKATSAWKGKTYTKNTQEYVSGSSVPITISAAFRAYDNWADSIEDHADFLVVNSRYAKVVGETNYKLACQYIKDAGYATDPTYPSKLISIIETNKLYEYDVIKKEEPIKQEPPAQTQDIHPTQQATVTTVKFNVNGALFETDGFMIDGRNFAAVRQLLETLGLNVEWQDGVVFVTSPPLVGKGKFRINYGEVVDLSRIMFEGHNYIKANELGVVGVDAIWNPDIGMPDLVTTVKPEEDNSPVG